MNGNLKQSPAASPHPSAAELQLLLSNDDASDATRRASAHLERCETCQSKLTTLAAAAEWWQDAQTLLSTESQPRWQPDLSQCSAVLPEMAETREPVEDRVLQLLGLPKHPEMLGRLGRYD